MAETPTDRERSEPGSGLRLPREVTTALRAELSTVAEQVLATVIAEVPSYSEPFRGRMGRNIENAVEIALGGFLELASSRRGFDHTTRVESVLEAAYALGRGEARAGRSMDALASAYRVGARTAWRDLSGSAVRAGLPAEDTAHFAELVFDYIDQLSLASVSGHADELATTGRIREQRRERLAQRILAGADPDDLAAVAERAEWTPPRTLTAVLLPTSMAGSARALLDERTLAAGDDAPGMDAVDREEDLAVLLVPDVEGPAARAALLQGLRARDAVVGPARPWERAALSLQRAVQARALPRGDPEARTPVDSEEHLADLVLASSPDVLDDLRERVLAPLAELRPAAADKLTATLRSWLLHHGRRDDVAAELFVHPQTVRYRMGQLRELYGDRLEDPTTVLELTIALARLPGSAPDANGPVTS